MKTISLTRKNLYDLVWSKPITVVAKEYGVNYSDVRKTCIDNNIPLPENGYWSKIKFGKPVKKFALPVDSEKGDDFEIIITKKVKKNAGLIDKINEIETASKQSIANAQRLKNPDILVVNARENLKGKKPWRDSGLVNTDSNFLKIMVSSSNIQRALRIMDSYIKLINSRGHKVLPKDGKLITDVYGEAITFYIQEKTKYQYITEEWGYKSRTRIPTGKLTFRYYATFEHNQRIIEDGLERLENKIPVIVAGIESLAQKEIDERLERERYRAEQKEKERIETERIKKERELIRMQKQDDENFETLLNQAQRWQKSKIVREYLNEIELQAKKHDELAPELSKWLKWAHDKTNKYDPLKY